MTKREAKLWRRIYIRALRTWSGKIARQHADSAVRDYRQSCLELAPATKENGQ